MAASDLAVLQDVKDWGGIASATDNAMLSRLITAVSGKIYSYLGRRVIVPATTMQRSDGLGNARLMLAHYPVLSVSSVVVDGATLSAGAYPAAGSVGTSAGWPPSGYDFTPWDGVPPGKPAVLDDETQAHGCGVPSGRA